MFKGLGLFLTTAVVSFYSFQSVAMDDIIEEENFVKNTLQRIKEDPIEASKDFIAENYLSIYPGIEKEAIEQNKDPLEYARWHYFNYGRTHGFENYTDDFNPEYYNLLYPGVRKEAIEQGKDPLKYARWHYFNYGRTHGFENPTKSFNAENYLSIYPGVEEEAVKLDKDPLEYARWHYFNYGHNHGFQNLPEDFSAEHYNLLYPGVEEEALKLGKDPLKYAKWHYFNYGRTHGFELTKSLGLFAAYIEHVNPLMNKNLAKAWARHAKNPERFLNILKSSGYDPRKKFAVQENPNAQLYHYPVPGDGTCGYWSLGLTREQAYDTLIQMINGDDNHDKNRYLAMIANGIFERARGGDLPKILKQEDYHRLHNGWVQAETTLDNVVRNLNTMLGNNGNALSVNDLLLQEEANEYVEEVLGYVYELEQKFRELKNWCSDINTIRKYVKAEILGGAWLDFLPDEVGRPSKLSMIDVIAELNGMDLVIYGVRPGNDPYNLKVLHQHISGRPNLPIRHILHLGNHYDRLVDNPVNIQVPNIKAKINLGDEEEVSDEELILAGSIVNKLRDQLQPERKQLEDDMLNLERERDAIIEGFEVIQRGTGEARYNQVLKEKKDLEVELGLELNQKMTREFIEKALMEDELAIGKIKKNHINGLLDQLGMNISTVIMPKKLPKLAPKNLDEILENLKQRYEWIEVREDGIYATADKTIYPDKVEEFKAEEANPEGIQKYYTRDPDNGEVDIYVEMIKDVKNTKMSGYHATQVLGTIYSARQLLIDREKLLKNPPKDCIYWTPMGNAGGYHHIDGENINFALVHFESSDKNSYAYDNIPLNQRLNYFHNSLVGTYLTAKKRGNLNHWVDKAFAGYCMDARSRTFMDYALLQEQENDSYLAIKDLPKKGGLNNAFIKIAEYLRKQFEDEKIEANRDNAEEMVQRLVGRMTKDGPLSKEDINDVLDYCENVMCIW